MWWHRGCVGGRGWGEGSAGGDGGWGGVGVEDGDILVVAGFLGEEENGLSEGLFGVAAVVGEGAVAAADGGDDVGVEFNGGMEDVVEKVA